MNEFLADFGKPDEDDAGWSFCYTCGRGMRQGRCSCCDYGEGPRCAICRMGPVKLPVCIRPGCHRLLMHDGDAACPKCDPSVRRVGRVA